MSKDQKDFEATQGVRHAIVALDGLAPHPRNYRRHPEAQLARLAASLARFGQVRSIVVQEGANGRYLLVAGHGLTEAARANGYTELRADVIPATWTPTQIEGYLIADNETTRGADDDLVQLAAMLEEQRAAGEHLESLGYSDDELAALLDDLAQAALAGDQRDVDDPDGGGDDFDTTPEESGPTRCQSGDLWQLGKHRLLCGDSTRAEDVARLMAGETAQAVVTDPPYGINREGITNDDPEGLRSLFDGVLRLLPLSDGVVVAFQSTRLFPVWLDASRAAGHDFQRMLWMYKAPDMTFPWRGWLLKSEAILVSILGQGEWNEVHPFAHDCYTVNVIGKELGNVEGWHASVKPLAPVADIVQRVSRDGGGIYEPFCGSGTTLIACERTGRLCYGIEIEPRYCDVILRRWEAETGREATLLARLEADDASA
ncbi:MAG TPA: DNA methyltransferase [Ktedonobacterales bacterium]|nr:DNA methyltransferase [Ktedonobacterales bacterium]